MRFYDFNLRYFKVDTDECFCNDEIFDNILCHIYNEECAKIPAYELGEYDFQFLSFYFNKKECKKLTPFMKK